MQAMPQSKDSGREGIKKGKYSKYKFVIPPKQRISEYYKSPFADGIRKTVFDYFGFTIEQGMERSRNHEVVRARNFTMFFLYQTNMSLPDIAHYMGYANHTAALHGIRTITNGIDPYDYYRQYYEDLKTKVNTGVKTIIAIIGESGAGKTVAQEYISTLFGIEKVLSHTTRPRRTPDENSHVFLSDDEFNALKGKIAEAKYGDYRYAGVMPKNVISTYVIDEQGLEMLINRRDLRVISIKIESPELSRIERVGIDRVKRCKSIKTITKFDYICSNNGTVDEFYDKIRKIMIKIIENGTK